MWRIEERNEVQQMMSLAFSKFLINHCPDPVHPQHSARYRIFLVLPEVLPLCLISKRVKYKFSINVNRIDLSVEKNLLTNKVKVDLMTGTNDC